MLISDPFLASAKALIPCWSLDDTAKYVCAVDFSLTTVEIDDIQEMGVKSLAKGWRSLSNAPERAIGILEEYESQLAKPTTIELPGVVIDIGQFSPKWSKPYQTTEYKWKIIQDQCQEWMDQGILELSTSPWASYVVLVSQTNSQGGIKHRLCGNYKQLNECITRQNFPLHHLEDLMDRMKGSVIFSVIDLQAAYLQLPLRPED